MLIFPESNSFSAIVYELAVIRDVVGRLRLYRHAFA
jgi:hypothetical protein